MPDFYYQKKAENFVQYEEDGDLPRPIIAPHYVDIDGRVLMIVQASSLVFGSIQDLDSGTEIATLRMQSAMGPAGLVYAFMPGEMRSVAKVLLERADKMDAEAAFKAREALDRALKGGK